MELTMAQVYTLRRLNSGTVYKARGDRRKADEIRNFGRRQISPVNAPSIPVLLRLGLVKFEYESKLEKTQYYRVGLTPEGIEAMHQNKDRK